MGLEASDNRAYFFFLFRSAQRFFIRSEAALRAAGDQLRFFFLEEVAAAFVLRLLPGFGPGFLRPGGRPGPRRAAFPPN